MTDAPERIWAFYAPHIADDENGATIVAHEQCHHGAASYIRADLLEAHIGAVLEEAAQEADNWFYDPDSDEVVDRRLGNAIRALRPDAMQALERVRREARVEVLRDALNLFVRQSWAYDALRARLAQEERDLRALIAAEERVEAQAPAPATDESKP